VRGLAFGARNLAAKELIYICLSQQAVSFGTGPKTATGEIAVGIRREMLV